MSHPATSDRIGVIDIGSNSVRLVIYDGLKRVPVPLFNEKLFCSLARGLEETGRLNPEGVTLAHEALTRFAAIAQALDVSKLLVVATAAVRDAEDGPEFARSLEERYGMHVSVVSGLEEARLSALGVTSSMSMTDGMMADLGGGSLELTEIRDGVITDCQSFPIGMLRLLAQAGTDRQKMADIIDKHLKSTPIISRLQGRSFYTVGGGFRTLARIHIAKVGHPIRILHNYTIPGQKFHKLCQAVVKMPSSTLERIPDVSRKRIDMMPCTALVAERIMALGKPSLVTFSAQGIREGFIYDMLSEDEKAKDPLFEAARHIMRLYRGTNKYANRLAQWLNPLFPKETSAQKRLRKAACILSEIACLEHMEYRAEIAFQRVMDAFLTGIDHVDRVFIAMAVYHRYSANPDLALVGELQKLLPPKALEQARIIGMSMRLARNIAAGAYTILEHTSLRLTKEQVILELDPTTLNLQGDAVTKRLNQLADVLERDYAVQAQG